MIILGLILASPVLALSINYIFPQKDIAARCSGYIIGIGFLLSLWLLANSFDTQTLVVNMLNINGLSLLLLSLVLIVSFVVHRFSLRYMFGDRLYNRFFCILAMLTFTAMIMVLADNVFLFWSAWSCSNLFLVLLMIHKKEWDAAKNSGTIALYTLGFGCVVLFLGLYILTLACSSSSILEIIRVANDKQSLFVASGMSMVLLAALTQSGIFPFQSWLISSLNSPTPVSAFMHAGLVNGGGILIVKFAPIFMLYPKLLSALFIVGCVSALLGTIWKLMQHDVKKMLACSTMSQMGFMMMQCGVGLFAAAIAHVCWHGLFKAYLFLSSGSAVSQNKNKILYSHSSFILLMLAFTGGILSMCTFAYITNKVISLDSANTFVLFFAFIAGTQLMLTWMRNYKTVLSFVGGAILSALAGCLYGTSIYLIEFLIPGVSSYHSESLSLISWIGMIAFGFFWLIFNIGLHEKIATSKLWCFFYMHLFNLSQPADKTNTALRNNYNY